MTKHEQYQLTFLKKQGKNRIDFYCTSSNVQNNVLAFKLMQMHPLESMALVTEIEAAENGINHDRFFFLDFDAASDNDSIEITDQNVVIDENLIVPHKDMKLILQEWNSFMQGL